MPDTTTGRFQSCEKYAKAFCMTKVYMTCNRATAIFTSLLLWHL